MPYAVGIDTIEIPRVQRVLERHGERFLKRVYTPTEVAFCRGRVPELAARFAAKEAVMKALGTGVRGIGWREIEVLPDRRASRSSTSTAGRRRAPKRSASTASISASATSGSMRSRLSSHLVTTKKTRR